MGTEDLIEHGTEPAPRGRSGLLVGLVAAAVLAAAAVATTRGGARPDADGSRSPSPRASSSSPVRASVPPEASSFLPPPDDSRPAFLDLPPAGRTGARFVLTSGGAGWYDVDSHRYTEIGGWQVAGGASVRQVVATTGGLVFTASAADPDGSDDREEEPVYRVAPGASRAVRFGNAVAVVPSYDRSRVLLVRWLDGDTLVETWDAAGRRVGATARRHGVVAVVGATSRGLVVQPPLPTSGGDRPTLWDLTTGRDTPLPDPGTALAVEDDAVVTAHWGNGTTELFVRHLTTGRVTHRTYSDDQDLGLPAVRGGRLAVLVHERQSGTSALEVTDVRAGTVVRAPVPFRAYDTTFTIAWSPDARTLALLVDTQRGSALAVWSAAGGFQLVTGAAPGERVAEA